MADGGWRTRSVLECGGRTPLLLRQPAGSRRFQSAGGLAQSKTWRLSVALFCFILLHSSFCLRAWGQSYSIDWYKIAGGGSTSTNGQYSIAGTIGQPDAGVLGGGSYTLQGGFWGVMAAVQTPGAPWLWVMRTTTNTVCVWWALSETSWQLQATTSLVTTGSVWTGCSYETNGATCYRIESPPSGNRFYRLRGP
jgi:hypothetical protein